MGNLVLKNQKKRKQAIAIMKPQETELICMRERQRETVCNCDCACVQYITACVCPHTHHSISTNHIQPSNNTSTVCSRREWSTGCRLQAVLNFSSRVWIWKLSSLNHWQGQEACSRGRRPYRTRLGPPPVFFLMYRFSCSPATGEWTLQLVLQGVSQ